VKELIFLLPDVPKLYLHELIIKWLWFKGCCWKYLRSAIDWVGVYQRTCTRLILGMTSYWISVYSV